MKLFVPASLPAGMHEEFNNGVPPDVDRVAAMFRGKNIFITGGTGFLGKVLIEKLLRVCHQLDTIYLLIRVKKGKQPQDRVHELFNSPLFESLRLYRPESIHQLHVIPGDVTLPDLGLSVEDSQLLKDRVHFVYHCAASVRFDEPIKQAVFMNTRGTKLMLDLAQECKHLECFEHISTAYCHVEQPVLREQLYDPPADPHKMIKMVETLETEELKIVEAEILKTNPNMYGYTKALSEALVGERMDTMPCIIARPSIVLPIWKEPMPGWTENLNGPVGVMVGAGKGVIRTMWARGDYSADLVPVDIVVNAMLVASWNFVCNHDVERRVYNLTTSSEVKITWFRYVEVLRKIGEKIPLNGALWYPGGSMKRTKLEHQICLVLFHLIPAYFLDMLIYLLGHKPFMVNLQKRITHGLDMFSFYATNQWEFHNDNIVALRPSLSARERQLYKIDAQGLNCHKYFENCVLSLRVHNLGETPDTLPAARRHMRVLYWVDIMTKILLCYLLYYFVTSYSETANSAVHSVVGYVRSFVAPSLMASDS